MMKSKKIFIMALSIAIISVISYGTVSAAAVDKYKVVDKIGGKKVKVPKWLAKNLGTTDLENMYQGKYAYVLQKRGDDLDYLEYWLDGVQVAVNVAQFLSREVNNVVVAATEGDGRQKEYSQSLTTSLSKAKIVGLRKEQAYWEKIQYTAGPNKGKTEYKYSVLFLIDRGNIDKLLSNQLEKALTGANSQIKQRVNEQMDKAIKSGAIDLDEETTTEE